MAESIDVKPTRFLNFRIGMVAYRDIPLVAWSGSIASAIVRESLKQFCSSNDCGLVNTSPFLIHQNIVGSGDMILVVMSGVSNDRYVKPYILTAGSRLEFSFSIWIRNDVGNVIELFNVIGSTLDRYGFTIDSFEFEVLSESSHTTSVDIGNKYVVRLFFGPTIMVFRGWRVLYPSPQRLVFSLARNYSCVFPLYSRELRRKARVLSRYIELIDNRCRVVSINIGRNRFVKAFFGVAVYGVYGVDKLKEFLMLLDIGGRLGVGKSRGIGFGYVRVDEVKPVG